MHVKRTFVLLVGFCLAISLTGFAQQPDMEKMMQEYMEKYATPGEHHRHLEKMAGKWTFENKFWPMPGAEMMKSTGSAEAKMIMGGRYLHSSYQGEMFGREFMGMGIAAYDQYKKKYVETWVDNHGTMVMMAEGTCGEQGNSRTVLAEFDDPMTHSPTWMRSVYRFRDPDHFTMEMFSKAPDGTEFKVMEIAHTRVK
jgi:hypothetical protein